MPMAYRQRQLINVYKGKSEELELGKAKSGKQDASPSVGSGGFAPAHILAFGSQALLRNIFPQVLLCNILSRKLPERIVKV